MSDSVVRQCLACGRLARLRISLRRHLPAWTCVALLSVMMCAAGCAGDKLKSIKGMEQFQNEVLASPQPVLVAFYKQGCATCAPLDPVLEKLNDEYKDRAVVAKCMLLTFFFGNTIPELRTKYDIEFYPTVLLFVNGEEQKRWVIHYKIESYREHVDKWLAAATQPASGPARRAATQPAMQASPRAAAQPTTQAAALVTTWPTPISDRNASAAPPSMPPSGP